MRLSAGVVLGFEPDGGALRDNRAASPIVAWALSEPAAIAWDDEGEQLWVAGLEGGETAVVRVPLKPLSRSDAWPKMPQAAVAVSRERMAQRTSSLRNGETVRTMLPRRPGGGLVWVLPSMNEFAEVPAFAEEETTATVTDPQTNSTYVATRSKYGTSNIYKIDGR
jgi:hypothetical protein